MKLYILGQNSDDKGSQLENLTKRILTKYGLTNVTRDEVSAGGNEIDVTAEIVQNAGLSEIRLLPYLIFIYHCNIMIYNNFI